MGEENEKKENDIGVGKGASRLRDLLQNEKKPPRMGCKHITGLVHLKRAALEVNPLRVLADGARVIRLRRIKQNASAAKHRRWQSQIGILPAVLQAKRWVLAPVIHSKTPKKGTQWVPLRFGADYGARTRHLHLGKVALYQMS